MALPQINHNSTDVKSYLIKLIDEVIEIIGDFRLGRFAQNQDVVEKALDVRLDGVGGALEKLLAQGASVLVRSLRRTDDLQRCKWSGRE